MTLTYETEELRLISLRYQWMHNRDWTQMAEEGEPVIMVEGKGVRVTDSNGRTWIDCFGGYGSINLGYGRTEIADAAYEQMKKVTFAPSDTITTPVVELCEKLAEITPGSLSRSFLTSGGSEANEMGLMIAKAYHARRGEGGRYKVISRNGSYHGVTGGVMWLGGNRVTYGNSDMEPIPPGMLIAPQPNSYRCELCRPDGSTSSECAIHCAQAIEDLILMHGADTVAAVIAEPVASLYAKPGDEYWPMVRDICDRHGVVLIADEIVTGFGRTGKLFGSNHWDLEPDIMTVGKGLCSSYLPVSASVVKKEIADYFGSEGNEFGQTFTFSGHPVAATAALKNLEIMERENLVENCAQVGLYLQEQLEQLMEDHVSVGDVRGIGLIYGVELVSDRETKASFPEEAEVAKRLNDKFIEHGLILETNGKVIGINPPLCITRDEVDEIVHALDSSIGDVEKELGIK